MELFKIERYNEEQVEVDQNNEDILLKKLLKKVKKRKKEQHGKSPKKLKTALDTNESSEKISESKENTKIIADTEENSCLTQTNTNEINKIVLSSKNLLSGTQNKTAVSENIDKSNFQVLGEDVFEKKQKVHMVLPSWLANPTIISNDFNQNSTEDLDSYDFLDSKLKKNLHSMNIKSLFPLQKSVIEFILKGQKMPSPFRPRDLCVSAPTGSGKTLAFAIPIVQSLLSRVECKVRALIVLPMNDLALQIYRVFKQLLFRTKLSVCLLSINGSISIEQKQLIGLCKDEYYSKVDIVVTTPGRLVEHLSCTNGFCLKSLKFLVIDEADRIMEQGFHSWLYHLSNHIKKTPDSLLSGCLPPLTLQNLENGVFDLPHKLLFSATLSQDPEKLQNLQLFLPKLFTTIVNLPEELMTKLTENYNTNEEVGKFIGKYTIPAELTEKFCITEQRIKPLTIFSLIKENEWKKFLCFTNSAESAQRLCIVLQQLFKKEKKIQELSAKLSPKVRSDTLKKLLIGEIDGIVCSDALARGIDIPGIDVVISYDIPRHVKTYIHRIGRTARAGCNGTSIVLLSPNQKQTFNEILKELGKNSIEEIKVVSSIEEDMAGEYNNALKELKKKLTEEKSTRLFKKRLEKLKTTKETKDFTSFMDRIQVQVSKEILALHKTSKTNKPKKTK